MSSLLLLLLLSATIPVRAQDPDLDKFTQETREIVSNFTTSLIRRCEIEIESIGLHAATEICRITAPQVYYEYSVKHKIILKGKMLARFQDTTMGKGCQPGLV